METFLAPQTLNLCWLDIYFKLLPAPVVPSSHGDFSVLKKDKADNLVVLESCVRSTNRIAVFFVVINATFGEQKRLVE